MATFKERLAQVLEEKNMKPIRLSELTGIDRGTISRYLNGKTKASQNNLYLVAKTLDVNEAWLMGHDVAKERVPDAVRNEQNAEYQDNLSVIRDNHLPDDFSTAEEALLWLAKQPVLAAYGGKNISDMSEEDQLKFARRILRYMRMESEEQDS